MLASPGELTAQSVLQPESSFQYPPAEASQEEVTNNPELFHATLKKVHELFDVTEKVPRVGGRELDLYMLYRNVTSLGGCERVIQTKHWREAAESFSFPETITSVSFSLRKAYFTFLWDYEQMYFFRNTGPRIPTPQHHSRNHDGGSDASETIMNPDGSIRSGKKRKAHDNVATSYMGLPVGAPTALVAHARLAGQSEAMMVGCKGSVSLDARFDAGYFCTVRVGRHEFKGMLYYPPPEHTVDMGTVREPRRLGRPKKSDTIDSETQLRLNQVLPRELPKDPHGPKPNKTPFNFFSGDARQKAKESYPELTQTEVTKKVGEMWQKANDDEKAPYIAMSNQDKQRYQAELEAYNYRLAAQAAQQQAQQAQQAVAQTQQYVAQQPLQVNGEYFGHGTLSMSLQDPGQHHQLQSHHVSLAAMQMPMNSADGMI
ncbi:hypothetical protein ABBQ32_007015 [Trebouxia sp. C0010 RCD-2024]